MIIGPIVTLKNTASRIAGRASHAAIGEALDERIEVQSEDEIGALAHAFNTMVENLRTAMQQLNVQEKTDSGHSQFDRRWDLDDRRQGNRFDR